MDLANDGYFRNQGVGSWEINLAAFLADLNTNQWDNILNGGIYQYNRPVGSPNRGAAFADAFALLTNRFAGDYRTLAAVQNLFGANAQLAFRNNIDGYCDGPLMRTLAGISEPVQSLIWPWAGADNTNHYFTHQELFNPNESSFDFTSRLSSAGTNVSTYDRYTFYRLLSQLGTDSTPESGKMNLNFVNVDVNGNVVSGMETNFISWTNSVQFFTNAADRLLRAYTTQWRNGNPTNFAATFYSVSPADLWSLTTLTNPASYPAFGIGHIPVLVSNQFVYSSPVNRLLQLAANLYDATTASNYPSVFRPLFSRDAGGLGTNVFISGYTNVALTLGLGLNDVQLNQPIDASTLATMSGVVSNYAVNVYGVPWIIGAKKGLPNFNEFTMQNVVVVERKLQVKRPTLAGLITTNQMYIFSVSNSLGAELWNSYESNYFSANVPSIQVLVRDNISMVLTKTNDGLGTMSVLKQIINGGFTNSFSTNVWPGSQWSRSSPPPNGQPQADSFFVPLNPTVSTVVLLTNSAYYYGPGTYTPPIGSGPFVGPGFIPQYLYPSNYLDIGVQQLPHLGLLTTNRLQVVILDGNHVIDYAQFDGPQSSRDLNAELQDPFSYGDANSAYMWSTNGYLNGLVPYGVINQINYSRGRVTPAGDAMAKTQPSWNAANQELEQAFFDAFWFKGNPKPLSPPINGQSFVVNTNLSQQAPFTPIRTCYEYISWQANDPLVHYLAGDLNYSGQDTTPPTGIHQWYSDAPVPRPTYGIKNNRYQPWGIMLQSTNTDPNPYNLAVKDPLMWQSDNWDFPTNKFPTVGWLGRVHRGTPWQTVYLKASDILGRFRRSGTNTNYIGTNTWVFWTGTLILIGATYTAPVQDRLLFDLFTTAFNDNATRGTLSVNVGPTNANLAAWSALFSGVVVVTNNAASISFVVALSHNISSSISIPPWHLQSDVASWPSNRRWCKS